MVGEDLPILLMGETGTGKSYLARLIHTWKQKTDALFLTLDCATFNPNLIESELFGHEKGAFTGANEKKSGLFELACGGTILLEEIENLRAETQAKLLRVLDDKTFRRVGGTEEMEVYFQLISTINVDLDALLKAGTLRKDFYFRIASVEFTLPPLRQRQEDILVFAEYFLKVLTKKHHKEFALTKASRNLLVSYPWPGNIRELKHALMAAAKLAKGAKLQKENFEWILRRAEPAKKPLQSLAQVEKAHINRVLKETGYKMSKTAKILGIAENTLRTKMKKYNLKTSSE